MRRKHSQTDELRQAMEKERLYCGRHRSSYSAWVWVNGKPKSSGCHRCAQELEDAKAKAHPGVSS